MLTKFWNSCSVDERINILGGFVAIVYVLRKLKKPVIPNSDKLFKWFAFVLRNEKEININWVGLTRYYIKLKFNLEIVDDMLPTQQYIEGIINQTDDLTYNQIMNGGNINELFGKKN
jgi:hypothetical protein